MSQPRTGSRVRPVVRRPLTVEDIQAFSDWLPTGDVRYELDDGQLLVFPPLTVAESGPATETMLALSVQAEDRLELGRAFARVGMILRRNPDRLVAPFAAFTLHRSPRHRCSAEGYFEELPEIVVDVRTKFDSESEVLAKVAEYLAAGVRVAWDLDPEAKSLTLHRADREPQTFRPGDSITCPDVLPGFEIPAAVLFPDE